MADRKLVRISEFLTVAQIAQADRIYCEDRPHFHQKVLAQIVLPNMEEIDRKLKQPNDPSYIAYAIEYVMMTANK